MGILHYGTERAELDDRALAHVQLLIVSKLRKQEAFLLSWTVEPQHGSGRISVWVDAGVPIGFRFDGSRAPAINRAWLEHMVEQSFTVTGTEVTSEAEFEAYAAASRATKDTA
ncbi:hypothetical protein [Plantibacter sp. YIM 135347]|uniref:DUF7882 family protein n=1 Tax=Plantibacter sp. YIM 135347 TaxID=3423919 RepID=UPI003D34AFD2